LTPEAIASIILTLVGQFIIAAGILVVAQAHRVQDKQALAAITEQAAAKLDATTKQTAANLADTNAESERLRQEAYDKQNRFFFEQYKELTIRIDDSNSEVAALKERAKVLDEIYQRDRTALVKSIADQQVQIDSLLSERDTLKKERDQAIETKIAAESKAAALEIQIAELRDQLLEATTAQVARDAEFERRIKQLEDQMTSLTAERDQAVAAAKADRERAEAAEARAAALEIRAATAEALATNLRRQLNDLALPVTPLSVPVIEPQLEKKD
jgi:chromosome segregation ATPase